MADDGYQRVAPVYDKIFDGINEGLRKVSLRLFPPAAGMKVLDVGCGTGSHLLLYKQSGCEVFGLDCSSAMLRVAREKLGPEASLHLGDAARSPFPDAAFDLVCSTLTLHEMAPASRTAVLKEMKRITRPDGRLLLVDFHPGKRSFPKGWLTRAFILVSEIAAGREHFMNQRQFMKNGGLPALVEGHDLSVVSRKIVSGGNLALFLLKR